MAHRKTRHTRRTRHAGPTRGRHAPYEATLRVLRADRAVALCPEGTFAVARGGLNGGMDGDVAEVELVRRGPGEPQAIVRCVLVRATTTLVGTYAVAGPLGVVVPLDGRSSRDFFVLPDDGSGQSLGVVEGDVVVARILAYPSRREEGIVTIEQRLGSSDGLDLPIERIIASHGFARAFSSTVLGETDGTLSLVEETLVEQRERRDLRDLCCVTVDPADARDFDDAVSCSRDERGHFHLGVHIADVTHYLAWGSSTDLEARRRTCSAYLVDRVLPMLPERLSNDVCSLRPGCDRLAMSVRLELDERGGLVGSSACASAIRSWARLSYGQVDELLETGAEGEVRRSVVREGVGAADDVVMTLRALDELAHLRARVRRERGSVDFDTEEPKVLLDECGHPTGVSVRKKTRATSLIEEAMLLANEVVAAMLVEEGREVAFRSHAKPTPSSMRAAVSALGKLGLLVEGDAGPLSEGNPHALAHVLGRVRGTSAEYPVNALLLRSMQRAVYTSHNCGHYALGAEAYCHFTSPIRRYPDVVVHRTLKRLLGVGCPCERPGGARGHMGRREWAEVDRLLPQLCVTCSEMEREADAAASESQKVKMAEFYADKVGRRFWGIVSGIERFGLFVRLDDTGAEGLVPIEALGEAWARFDEGSLTMMGESTGARWRLGQRVCVVVARCSPDKGQINFRLPPRHTGAE